MMALPLRQVEQAAQPTDSVTPGPAVRHAGHLPERDPSNARNLVEIEHAPEWTMYPPVFFDHSGDHRGNAGEALELRHVRGVQVHAAQALGDRRLKVGGIRRRQ